MTTQEVRQKRLEILTWERDHRNISNRGTDQYGNCVYSHKCNGGCAIGRLISDELAEQISEGGIVEEVFHFLPEEIQELEQSFLNDLQSWHDEITNWNRSGLSEKGLNWWEDLRRKWCV